MVKQQYKRCIVHIKAQTWDVLAVVLENPDAFLICPF